MLKWLDGKKTYIAALVGVAAVVVPVIGVPVAVANAVAIASGLVAVYGRMDASRKISEAYEAGKEIGKELRP